MLKGRQSRHKHIPTHSMKKKSIQLIYHEQQSIPTGAIRLLINPEKQHAWLPRVAVCCDLTPGKGKKKIRLRRRVKPAADLKTPSAHPALPAVTSPLHRTGCEHSQRCESRRKLVNEKKSTETNLASDRDAEPGVANQLCHSIYSPAGWNKRSTPPIPQLECSSFSLTLSKKGLEDVGCYLFFKLKRESEATGNILRGQTGDAGRKARRLSNSQGITIRCGTHQSTSHGPGHTGRELGVPTLHPRSACGAKPGD